MNNMRRFIGKAGGLLLLPASAIVNRQGKILQKKAGTMLPLQPNRKDTITMKKSTAAAILVLFAAIAGALSAAYLYLRRREKELDEYEQLLFSEDFSHEEPDDTDDAEDMPAL